METNYYNKNLLSLASANNNLVTKINELESSNSFKFIESKNSKIIPCTSDGSRPLHSKLDPIREASRFPTMYKSHGFLIFLGLGGGYHIKPFLENNKHSNILIIDNNIQQLKATLEKLDLSYIFLDPSVKLLIDPSPEELFNFIIENYIPAICGDVTTIPLRQRVNSEKDFFETVIVTIRHALNSISDDYTVQTRFGKKWFSNTLNNLNQVTHNKPVLKPIKSAIITAAGPSLENNYDEIRELQKTSTLIATDTTAPALLENNIRPDIIISIDCQHISYYHFIKEIPKDIPLVLDITSPRKLSTLFDTVYFFTSGNPLGQYINRHYKMFPSLNTSGGSVTHAALALADSLNAKNIYLFGADFSYPYGKSYARGTYIYDFFDKTSNRLKSTESNFFSFIMQSNNILIETLKDGFRYVTKPMIGYKTNLEVASENLHAKLHVKEGDGCKINIDNNKPHVHSILPLFAEGKIKQNSYNFLIEYKKLLLSLPEISFPIDSYLDQLSRDQQLVWLTVIPVLASNRKDRDLDSNLMKETLDWMISRINRHIYMEEQKKGA